MKSIEEQLILHEGLKLKPYRCPAGYLTIGVGRNLETKGLSRDEALFLLRNDIQECVEDLERYPWFAQLDPVRRKVIIDMRFNLGPNRFRQFQRMLAALERQAYEEAAKEMLDSKWAQQVKTRAQRLVEMMRTGEDYTD